MMLSDPEKLGYTVPEACAATGLSRSLLYKLMKSGELPFRKVRSRTVLLKRDLENVLTRAHPLGKIPTPINQETEMSQVKKELVHDTRLNVKLPYSLKSDFDAACWAANRIPSDIVRVLLQEFINRRRKRR